jgi:hypothetical protein
MFCATVRDICMAHRVSKGTFCRRACSVFWDTSHECSSTRPDVFWLPSVCRHRWMSETWVRFPSIAKDILRQASRPTRNKSHLPLYIGHRVFFFCESKWSGREACYWFPPSKRIQNAWSLYNKSYSWWPKHRDNLIFQLATVRSREGPQFHCACLVQYSSATFWDTPSPADLLYKPQNVSTEDHHQEVQLNNTKQSHLDTQMITSVLMVGGRNILRSGKQVSFRQYTATLVVF